jgi:hypothetical protein
VFSEQLDCAGAPEAERNRSPSPCVRYYYEGKIGPEPPQCSPSTAALLSIGSGPQAPCRFPPTGMALFVASGYGGRYRRVVDCYLAHLGCVPFAERATAYSRNPFESSVLASLSVSVAC